jgi:hypothetical protein
MCEIGAQRKSKERGGAGSQELHTSEKRRKEEMQKGESEIAETPKKKKSKG